MLYVKRWKKSLIVVLSVLLVTGALGELARRVVLAQTATVGTKLHVDSFNLAFSNVGGPKRLAVAVVGVRDENGNPIVGALVEGNWSGCFSYKGSATTQLVTYYNPDGTVLKVAAEARIVADKAYSCWGQPVKCFFTFTVTNISEAGYTYDATANVKTTASTQCQ